MLLRAGRIAAGPRRAAGRLRAVACGLVAACLLIASPAAADWQPVGDSSATAASFLTVEGIGGVPHIAYADAAGGLRVRRLSDDGGHWLPLGDAPVNASGRVAGVPPALLDAGGVPYVAWTQANASFSEFHVHVARFDAGTNTWSEPDAANLAVNASDMAGAPKLAFFGGQVYVTWTERLLSDTPPTQLYVKRLVADAWQQPASGSLNANPQHGAQAPQIATSGGKLWVAWTELTPHGPDAPTAELLVKRLSDDGTAWVEPAARPTPSDSNYGGTLGLTDRGGAPYLLYRQDDAQGNSSLHVKRLNAGAPEWELVGGDPRPEPAHLLYGATLGSTGGVPYVAWADRVGQDPLQMRVTRLNASGNGWEEPVPTSLNADPARSGNSLAVADNLPDAYVAWVESATNVPDITVVKRLEPSLSPGALDFAPQPLGTVSAPRSLVFTNLTVRPVHFAAGAAALGGPDAAAFGISSDGCSSTTVARGDSCTIALAFTPQAVRAHQATVSLASDAPGSPHTASLSGSSPGPPPPPGSVGVSINGGAQFTNDRDVDLNVVWQLGDNTILLANDGGFVGAESVPVAAHVAWRLESSGPERLPKTVYARFGDRSQTFTDDIILDETAPTLSSVTFAAKRTVRIAARDRTSGLRSYQLTHGKAHPGKRHRFHRTVHYKGKPRKLYVRVFDRAGNHSRWARAKHRRRR
jgi:hypothetical protein